MTRRLPRLLFIWLTITGCGRSAPGIADAPQSSAAGTRTLTVRDTTVTAVFEAVGAAEAIQRATLSTRLMGNVTAVLVHEGDRVGAGATLLRLDAAHDFAVIEIGANHPGEVASLAALVRPRIGLVTNAGR